MAKSDTKEYPQPTCEDYLSYYVHQNEWKPTRPIGPIGAMSASPGPATVNLPSTIGEERHDPTRYKAPGYKIGQKLHTDKTKIGPGPGKYNIRDLTNKGKDNSKAPKIGKANRFSDKFAFAGISPGPAAYRRQDGDRLVYPRTPAYSVPHTERGKAKAVTTPAPNAYNLPPVLGPGKTPVVTGPSYSVGKANRMSEPKSQQNPGPAAYILPSSNTNMNKAPSYSMGTKAAPPIGGTYTPGPAAHNAHMVKCDKYSTPRISFGIKHSPYKALPGFAAEK